MDEFRAALRELLPTGSMWAFGVASSFWGCIIVGVDLLANRLARRSLLGLEYGSIGQSARNFTIWGVGAGLAGLLGVAFGLFQLTMQASLLAGLGWTTVLPRLLKSVATHEDEQPS